MSGAEATPPLQDDTAVVGSAPPPRKRVRRVSKTAAGAVSCTPVAADPRPAGVAPNLSGVTEQAADPDAGAPAVLDVYNPDANSTRETEDSVGSTPVAPDDLNLAALSGTPSAAASAGNSLQQPTEAEGLGGAPCRKRGRTVSLAPTEKLHEVGGPVEGHACVAAPPLQPLCARSSSLSRPEGTAAVANATATHSPGPMTAPPSVLTSTGTVPVPQPQPQQEKRLRQPTLVAFGVGLDAATVKREMAEKDAKITELEAQLEQSKEDLAKYCEELARRDAGVIFVKQHTDQLETKLQKYRDFMRVEMLQLAKRLRREARRLMYDKQFELGQIAMWQSNGQEMWIEGNTPKELIMELKELTQRRDEVEAQKKLAEKRLKHTLKSGDEDSTALDVQESVMEAEEAVQIYASKYAAINNAIAAIKQRQAELKSTVRAFIKEIHRISYEDASDFLSISSIGRNGRYILMTLLGKGGFSEVWKAFDVSEGQYVACKIHRVNRDWAPQRRENYLLHAERELEIMRGLDHPRLTKLYEVFQFNQTIFVSVIECCRGMDLDTYLKRNHRMKEADAKLILLQVVSALRHLAAQERPIIHYDLKPANILFEFDDPSCLEIKITDFGLSKIIPNANGADGPSDNPSVELTSPGAGTLWYLPPECFDTTGGAKINSKVDVWSCGVIFYQMLFGKLPFADGESQQRIWREKLIVSSSRTLEFPDLPKVSNEAKDLIRKCLEPNVLQRCDIFQLSSHSYLLSKRTARIMKAPAAPPNL